MDSPNFSIKNKGPISQKFRSLGITDFSSACEHVKQLPYKRTSSKTNHLLVLQEQCGTCSSKHALLAKLAEENDVSEISLKIGIYKMKSDNTPGIDNIIPANIEFIPEAHCYLKYQGKRLDYTHTGTAQIPESDFLEEFDIKPDEIGPKKEKLHKAFIKKWTKDHSKMNAEEIWRIRETCIDKLSR